MRKLNVTCKDIGKELRNYFSKPLGTVEIVNLDTVFVVDQKDVKKSVDEQRYRVHSGDAILCADADFENLCRYIEHADTKNTMVWRIVRQIREKIYKEGSESFFIPDINADPGCCLNVSVIAHSDNDDMELAFEISHEDIYGLTEKQVCLRCPYDSTETEWVTILKKIIR